ncbi:MAG: RNA polymerase sigma factor, partial [Anaerolineales bacterium]
MDSELALMIQEGHASDPRVIDAIVQQYAPNVYHLGLGLLNGHPDAQTNARKITTGAFIAALNDPESFRGREDIRSWLYGVAVRIARGNRPRRGPRASTPPGWDADSRVDALPEGDRLPIILRYGHRLTLPQIAQILHIPEHKVHKRLARARRKLLAGERPG